jgi:parallel beta-helix repeat protein
MRRIREHLTYANVMATIAVFMALSAIAGWLAIGGGQALAAQVKCGDTITTNTKLHKDLINCPNNGIVIGADDITLDLNGHLVDGDGTPTAGCDAATEFCDEGLVALGHDGLTIKHGRVHEFADGVAVGRARHARLLRLSSSRNTFFGIVLFRAARSLVRNSSGNRNPPPEGDGMGLFASHRVRVLNSSFKHNAQPGIHVAFDSNNNLIMGNVISRNDPGIALERADRNRVRRNRFVGNGASVLIVPGSRNVISRNRILRGDSGIGIEGGRGNLVARNILVRPRRTGVYLAIQHPPIGGTNNVVRRNLVKGSGGDGFLVRQEDHRSLLKHNVAKRAGDDGFDVRSRSTTLTKNQAVHNNDLGIEAVPSVIDGGGNKAHGNGDPRQCTNVVCG